MRFFRSEVKAPSPRLRIGRTLLLGLGLSIIGTGAQAAALTAVHDYRYLVSGLAYPESQYPSLVHEFEGLAFTADGDLWASIAPNDDPKTFHFPKKEFWRLDLTTNRVAESIPDTFQAPGLLLQLVNPVALAAAGGQLIVGENYRALRALHQPLLTSDDIIWAFTPGVSTPSKPDWRFSLPTASCDGLAGAAFAAGKLYVTCQSKGSILQIDVPTGKISKEFSLGSQLLGLEAIDDNHLLVGDYSNHELLVFDLTQQQITDSIDLRNLFTGRDSDYFKLTGEEYSVQVIPSEGYRSIPDPDGLAYRDGKIYMAFDGDLRIFEIAMTMSVPEPGTLGLVGAGLLGFACRRSRRAATILQYPPNPMARSVPPGMPPTSPCDHSRKVVVRAAWDQ